MVIFQIAGVETLQCNVSTVACALAGSGEVDTDIVQVTRVFHTGADPPWNV